MTKSFRTFFCCLLMMLTGISTAYAGEGHGLEERTGERALCPVCRVHEGETKEEVVVAVALFEGQEFGLCSETCRETFLEAPASYLPPVFPRPAPKFVVLGLDGAEVPSETYRGKVMLLDFWATWCPPCVRDLPSLTRLHERYEDDGLVVVSISIDEGENADRKVARMIKRRRARHPVFLDAALDSAWAAYQVRVVPTQYLVDAEGQIVAQWSGKVDLEVVEAEIARLLAADTG
ncbi:MAG: redoxin domain-containing protein [Acidobacteriota bacterium]